MNPPTRRQDLAARCVALLGKSALLRRAASLPVGRSRRERCEAKSFVAGAKSLVEPVSLASYAPSLCSYSSQFGVIRREHRRLAFPPAKRQNRTASEGGVISEATAQIPAKISSKDGDLGSCLLKPSGRAFGSQ